MRVPRRFYMKCTGCGFKHYLADYRWWARTKMWWEEFVEEEAWRGCAYRGRMEFTDGLEDRR